MTEFVEMKSQIAVVMLAEELNYARASERLNITQPELNRQITELENQLALHVFRVSGPHVSSNSLRSRRWKQDTGLKV